MKNKKKEVNADSSKKTEKEKKNKEKGDKKRKRDQVQETKQKGDKKRKRDHVEVTKQKEDKIPKCDQVEVNSKPELKRHKSEANGLALQLQDLVSKLSKELSLAPSSILEASDISSLCQTKPTTKEELKLILSDQKVRICGKEVLKIINAKPTNSIKTTTTTKSFQKKMPLDLCMDDDFQ